MGFKLEDIVHPDSMILAEQFQCGVCLCIVEEPVQTMCHHVFCKACLDHGPELSCPTCRTEFSEADLPHKPLRDCNVPLMRMMSKMKVFCPYRTAATASARAAWLDGMDTEVSCGWCGSYSDLLATHAKQCDLFEVICPNGCGERLIRKDLSDHQKECTSNFQLCAICNTLVKVGGMRQHKKENSELHADLLEKRVAELEKMVDGIPERTVSLLDRRLQHFEQTLMSRIERLSAMHQTPAASRVPPPHAAPPLWRAPPTPSGNRHLPTGNVSWRSFPRDPYANDGPPDEDF